MTIQLSPAHLKWLEAEVAAGRFATVEDGVTQVLAERIEMELSDFDWAKPYIDEALKSVEEGRVISQQEFELEMDRIIENLRGS